MTERPVLTENAWGLSARDYELFRGLIYEKSGINLGPKKQQLLRARLGKRLRTIELPHMLAARHKVAWLVRSLE